jgi:RNA polymerase sigma-70 factor, ECF subfamily
MTTVTLETPSLFVLVPWIKTQPTKESVLPEQAEMTRGVAPLQPAPSQTAAVSTSDLAYDQLISAPISRGEMTHVMPIVQAKEDLTDDQLIAAICDGAAWAMELLYERHARYAYALAYRILHDVSAAEDVVQEAFLSVWRKAGSYQKQHGSVHSWIQAIVHHRAIDTLRTAAYRDQQWAKGSYSTENEQDPVSEQPDVWEQAWHSEQQQAIRSVLAQLPAEQRLVIEQAYFGGYTHAEIAEQWHIPLGTVKGRMRLGLQKMKHLLEERGIDAL